MIVFWTTITVLAIFFLLVTVLLLLFLHGHDKGRERSRTLQITAFILLVINSSMLLVSSAQFIDEMITARLLLKFTAAFLLAISFFLELKHILEKEKPVKKINNKKHPAKSHKKK